jgi:hypothetical protein
MSHQIADEKVRQEISNAVESVEWHLVNSDATNDLMSKIRQGWTLDQCRNHVIYQILFIRWHLCASSAECNPERFFLSYLKEEIKANGNVEDLKLPVFTALKPSPEPAQ